MYKPVVQKFITLSRSEVLTIDATAIAGLLILFTISSLGGFSDGTKVAIFSLKLYFGAFVASSVVSFTLSAIYEVNHEMKVKKRIILKKLENRLQDSEIKNNMEQQQRIQKSINRWLKRVKILQPIDEVLESGEATIIGINYMRMGFILAAAAVTVVQLLYIFDLLGSYN